MAINCLLFLEFSRVCLTCLPMFTHPWHMSTNCHLETCCFMYIAMSTAENVLNIPNIACWKTWPSAPFTNHPAKHQECHANPILEEGSQATAGHRACHSKLHLVVDVNVVCKGVAAVHCCEALPYQALKLLDDIVQDLLVHKVRDLLVHECHDLHHALRL